MNDKIQMLNDELNPKFKFQMTNVKRQIADVVDCLRSGGVIAHATETCYGFACDAFNKEALYRLYRLKGMPENKPVSIMVMDLSGGRRCAEFNETALRVAGRFWPGPVTLVLPRSAALPDILNPEASFIGLRCPDHALTQAILAAFGRSLVTTSANISGEKEVYSAGEIKLPVDAILDSGKIPFHAPSTVIKIREEGYEILRRGELADDIEQFLRS